MPLNANLYGFDEKNLQSKNFHEKSRKFSAREEIPLQRKEIFSKFRLRNFGAEIFMKKFRRGLEPSPAEKSAKSAHDHGRPNF